MFVRTKTIKSSKYAYLVDNTWTPTGSRQTVTAYIGKCITPPRQQTTTPTLNPNNTYQELITTLVHNILLDHGFTEHNGTYTNNTTHITPHTYKFTHNNKPTVLAINNGHLCEHTLLELHTLTPHQQQTNTAHNLASTLLKAGLTTTPENMAVLFEKLHPE